MSRKMSVQDIEVFGKKVFVRVDFNVPMENGEITDDTRIRAALPTIIYLLDNGAKVILATHLGRPKGKVVEGFRVDAIAKRLASFLGIPISKVNDCGGEESIKAVRQMENGQVLLLENVRFYPGEEKNDPQFAKDLAFLADIYVNDAFGAAHRAHASTEGIAQFLPAVAGLLMEKELRALGTALENPERPFVSILGGAKISDKIPVVKNLLDKVDVLLIGGGMANTFLAAKGIEMGKSLVEKEMIETAKELIQQAESKGIQLVLPEDLVVAFEFKGDAEATVVDINQIPEDKMALDIGPKTAEKYSNVVNTAKTVVWNGPLGVFEFDQFAKGTVAVANAMANTEATTIVGGGDVVAAVEKAGVAARISHISTGGGASLEFLEGKILPGVAALNEAE